MTAESLGVVGLFGLLLVKEMGLPVPVPGDLVVIAAGVAAVHGDLDPAPTLAAILVAGYLGGSVQFVLLRGGLRRPLLAALGRVGLPEKRIERQADRLRRTGLRGVALSRATPGLRVVAIAASALAAVPPAAFAAGLIIGNTAFVGFHFALGFVVGPPALALVASAGTLVIAATVGLLIVGVAGWWAMARWRDRRARAATVGEAAPEATGETRGEAAGARSAALDWADATCPACLVLGLAELRSES